MRLAEEAKLRNQMSAKKAKAEAERKHQVGVPQRSLTFKDIFKTSVYCMYHLKMNCNGSFKFRISRLSFVEYFLGLIQYVYVHSRNGYAGNQAARLYFNFSCVCGSCFFLLDSVHIFFRNTQHYY